MSHGVSATQHIARAALKAKKPRSPGFCTASLRRVTPDLALIFVVFSGSLDAARRNERGQGGRPGLLCPDSVELRAGPSGTGHSWRPRLQVTPSARRNTSGPPEKGGWTTR